MYQRHGRVRTYPGFVAGTEKIVGRLDPLHFEFRRPTRPRLLGRVRGLEVCDRRLHAGTRLGVGKHHIYPRELHKSR